MLRTRTRRHDSLLLPLLLSAAGHGGLLVGFGVFSLLAALFGPDRPVLDLDRTMEVAMVELPKSRSTMPDRATRAPRPAGRPEPAPKPAPPEVKHTSDLAVQTDQAASAPGVEQRQLDDALAALEQLEREAQMEAALGSLDQDASSPDGNPDAAPVSGNVGDPSDPELARYIAKLRKVFMDQFHPLQAVREANPGIRCVVHVRVDPSSGAVQSFEIRKPSGNPSFDAAATRAVEAVRSIPLPPEAYRDRMAAGYDIEFK